jgi:hypothetical protein
MLDPALWQDLHSSFEFLSTKLTSLLWLSNHPLCSFPRIACHASLGASSGRELFPWPRILLTSFRHTLSFRTQPRSFRLLQILIQKNASRVITSWEWIESHHPFLVERYNQEAVLHWAVLGMSPPTPALLQSSCTCELCWNLERVQEYSTDAAKSRLGLTRPYQRCTSIPALAYLSSVLWVLARFALGILLKRGCYKLTNMMIWHFIIIIKQIIVHTFVVIVIEIKGLPKNVL